jgi:hypothetical protein
MIIKVFGTYCDAEDWQLAIQLFLEGIREQTAEVKNDPTLIFEWQDDPEFTGNLKIEFDFSNNCLIFSGSTNKEAGPEIMSADKYEVIPITFNNLAAIIAAFAEISTTQRPDLLIAFFLTQDFRVNLWRCGKEFYFSATTAPT